MRMRSVLPTVMLTTIARSSMKLVPKWKATELGYDFDGDCSNVRILVDRRDHDHGHILEVGCSAPRQRTSRLRFKSKRPEACRCCMDETVQTLAVKSAGVSSSRVPELIFAEPSRRPHDPTRRPFSRSRHRCQENEYFYQ